MGGDGRGKDQLRPADAAGAEEAPQQQQQQQQMEEFFGLLRSIGEMRDRRRGKGGGGSSSPRKKARVARSTAWIPAFAWEDFAGRDAAPGERPATALPVSPKNGEEREEKILLEERKPLDLNLSL